MAIKFYTDEHIHPGVVKALQKREIDVLTAQQADMQEVEDKKHLEFSTLQRRTLVTQDADFRLLHEKMEHSGIAFTHQKTPMRRIIEGLISIFEILTEDDMKNHVENL